MFKEVISTTPFTTDIANQVFANITGSSFRGDTSFLATLRALAGSIVPKEESINLFFMSSNYTESVIKSCSPSGAIAGFTNGLEAGNGNYVIHNLHGGESDNHACMQIIEDNFISECSEFQRMEKVTDFFRKSFKVLCYINPNKKTVFIFIDRLDIRKLHYLQCSIIASLPWYFSLDEGIGENEMFLIQACREKTPDSYNAIIAKIASKYDFRSHHIRQSLKGYEAQYEKMRLGDIGNNIERMDREITDYNNAIGERLSQRREYCIQLLGLKAKIDQVGDDSEIMDYFLCNRKLHLESVSGTRISFCVSDYLSYFDKEIAERTINNKRSFVYINGGGSPYSVAEPEEITKLMRAVFIDEILRIKFCAAFYFDINRNIFCNTGHEFPAELSEFMPNPHINRYQCLGDNLQTINNMLREYNYIGAIEQCLASCKSLNWGDGTVMEYFMKDLLTGAYTNNCCIELPDGSVVNPLRAIEWLEAQEAENNIEEVEEEQEEETENE